MQAAKNENIINLQVRPHQEVKPKRRWVWKPLNLMQAWLEGEDKQPSKVFAYVVLVSSAVMLVGQIARWII